MRTLGGVHSRWYEVEKNRSNHHIHRVPTLCFRDSRLLSETHHQPINPSSQIACKFSLLQCKQTASSQLKYSKDHRDTNLRQYSQRIIHASA